MALNQTQRDHAIQMIDCAIDKKKTAISHNTPTKKEYIEMNFKMSERFTLKQILAASKERYYSATIEVTELLDAQEAYEECCDNIRKENVIVTAGLTALAFDLKGKVMFGNDFSVIADALEQIANFN